MPSTEYFRRQSDICVQLSLIASSEEVSSRLIEMAQEYQTRATALAAKSNSPPAGAPDASADRDTNGP
jgi:hypothetical protein